MLVRALKVLRFLSFGQTRTAIATAALVQPGDEGRAYGRTSPFWQPRMNRQIVSGDEWPDVSGITNVSQTRGRSA
jgi:hypothetical protein